MDTRRLRNPAFLAAVALLALPGVALPAIVWMLRIHLNKRPIEAELKMTSISAETERFRQLGTDKRFGDDVQETLGTHNYISRFYAEKSGATQRGAELHVAYYTGTIDTVPHVPERCMVGGGWNISGGPWVVDVPLDRSGWIEDDAATSEVRAAGWSSETIWTARLGPMSRSPGSRVRLPAGIERLQVRVTQFSDPANGQTMYAGYFFIANGGLTASAENVRLLAYDLRSEYAYYVKVQVSSADAKSPEDLAALTGRLMDDLLADIMLCVPDWVDVLRGDYPADNPRKKELNSGRAPGSARGGQTLRNESLLGRGVSKEGIAWLLV